MIYRSKEFQNRAARMQNRGVANSLGQRPGSSSDSTGGHYVYVI